MSLLTKLNGPQTFGSGPWFWGTLMAFALLALAAPALVSEYTITEFAYYLLWVFMALGLSLMWGYAGILSFGQTAFFGIGGYAYGVLSINLGAAHGMALFSVVCAVGVAGMSAVVFGYFMFYGRVKDVFLGIMTLCLTLVLETFMQQTAGSQWAIGRAALNGYNGMGGMPTISIPFFGGPMVLEGRGLYWALMSLVAVVYCLLRILINSDFGRVLVAIRESPERATALGYDIRPYQLVTFVIGSMLAALSGVFFTSWGTYITPSSMGLLAAIGPVVWVTVGGRRDLTACILSTVILVWISQALTEYGAQYALVVMGIVLAVCVVLVPDGLVVVLFRWAAMPLRRSKGRSAGRVRGWR